MNFAMLLNCKADAVSGSFVNQNEKLQSGAIALQRKPTCDRVALVALIHLHVICCDGRNLGAVAWLYRDDHVHRNVA